MQLPATVLFELHSPAVDALSWALCVGRSGETGRLGGLVAGYEERLSALVEEMGEAQAGGEGKEAAGRNAINKQQMGHGHRRMRQEGKLQLEHFQAWLGRKIVAPECRLRL